MLEFFRRLLAGLPGRSDDRAKTAPLSEKQIESIVQQQEAGSRGAAAHRCNAANRLASSASTMRTASWRSPPRLPACPTTCPSACTPWPMEWADINSASWPATRPCGSSPGDVMRKFHSYLFDMPTQQPDEALQEIVEAAIQEAHRVVQKEAPGSGTTVTAALVLGQQVTIGHVGDSRAYSIHPSGRIEQLTQDHSLVRRLEELGHLNKEEAAAFPHRNVLIRAVGQGEDVDADIFTIPFPHGCTLMLCTDGLWGVISEDTIRRAVNDAPTLQRACNTLVNAANAAGGPDNISVVLVQMIG